MNIQEHIRKLLQENHDIRPNLKKMMDQIGIYHAAKSVGGFDSLVKILKLNLNDPHSNRLLVKNFIEFSNRVPRLNKILNDDDIKIIDVKIEESASGKQKINILFETEDTAANIESWIINVFKSELEEFFPFKIRKTYEPNFSVKDSDILIGANKIKYDNLGNIINEEEENNTPLHKLKTMIDKIGIFKTAKAVGGIDNLERYFSDDQDLSKLFKSLKGTINVYYHSAKEYIEFPVKLQIIDKKNNVWNTTTYPIYEIRYNDSVLTDIEKKKFESFIFNAINDLNFSNLDIDVPRKLFNNDSFSHIDLVNGKKYQNLAKNDYDDDDIKKIHKKFLQSRHIKESVFLKENKLPLEVIRRLDYHKFEKMMRNGTSYIWYESKSKEEFKHKLLRATLENYLYYSKDKIEIDDLNQDEVNNYIDHLKEIFNPVLDMYYKNLKKERGINESQNNSIQDKLQNRLESEGLIMLSKRVGGIKNLSRLLNKQIDDLILEYFKNKKVNTIDLPIDVGGYDFNFELINVDIDQLRYSGSLENEVKDFYIFDFFYQINEGSVTVIFDDGETYDLRSEELKNRSYFWEIKHEIQNILEDYSEDLISELFPKKRTEFRINIDYTMK